MAGMDDNPYQAPLRKPEPPHRPSLPPLGGPQIVFAIIFCGVSGFIAVKLLSNLLGERESQTVNFILVTAMMCLAGIFAMGLISNLRKPK
jgi:hypothetical protein